jgi:hypothetical protein
MEQCRRLMNKVPHAKSMGLPDTARGIDSNACLVCMLGSLILLQILPQIQYAESGGSANNDTGDSLEIRFQLTHIDHLAERFGRVGGAEVSRPEPNRGVRQLACIEWLPASGPSSMLVASPKMEHWKQITRGVQLVERSWPGPITVSLFCRARPRFGSRCITTSRSKRCHAQTRGGQNPLRRSLRRTQTLSCNSHRASGNPRWCGVRREA